MLPSRFKALNSETSEESDSTETPAVTREALEQKAIAQYQVALQLEQKGEWEQTEKILRNLLKIDIITQITGKMAGSGNTQTSLLHLKYCITMNLGHCLAQQKKMEKALKCYVKATKLDNDDLNLWYRMGKTAMTIADLHLAVSAFEEGLRCSPNHWPCIDNLVTITYAIGDYMACLFYISKGLNMDVGFLKGHAFKEKIFTIFPSLVTGFHMYYPKCTFPVKPDSINLSADKVHNLFKEAESLKDKESEKCDSYYLKPEEPLRPQFKVKLNSWINLSKCLLYLYDLAEHSTPRKIAFTSLKFTPKEDNGGMPVEIEDVGTDDEDAELNEKNQPQEVDEEEQGKPGRSNGNLMEKLASSQKRRSARVRSTIRREEPSLAEAFRKLIPSHLLPLDIKDLREGESLTDELDTMDLYRLFELKDSSDTSKVEKLDEKERNELLVQEGYFGTESEESDIFTFKQEIELSEKNIIDAMHCLLLKVADKWKLHWPELLGKYFIQINLIVQQYFPIAVKSHDMVSSFYEDVNILLFGELLLYEWIKKGKRKGLPSPLGFTSFGGEFSSLNLGKLNQQAALTDDVDFIARSYWLEALLFLHCGDKEASVRALQQIIDDERCEKICIKIPNVTHNSVISSKIAATLLKALKRNKSLSQVMDLYNSGYYNEVTDILSDSLSVDPDNSTTCDTISRSMQYAIILDSFWKLLKFKECLYWTECCLHESLNHYRNASDEEERQDCARVIVNTLKGIMNLIEKQGLEIFKTLVAERLSRLVHTLSSIINHQMEAPENSTEMPIESVSPWIILHYIIKYDEGLMNRNIKSYKEDEEEELLPSIQILFQGHEYLGRRSWCCFDEGALLFHTLDTLYPLTQSLPPESQNLININQQIDHIFYCLYGIQKKHKTRHIVEHNVLGLALTWNRAQQVFIFTRPRELPSYDTIGKCCMSADNEALYLKLIKLVPDNCNPKRLVNEMNRYIEGETEEIPKNDCLLPAEVADIYFLLAHFYYKTKSWGKVWLYNLLDVCANPNRHASWAGLALSRGTEIETRLNSCETIKDEGSLLSDSRTVCRCYKRSLSLDPTQNTLWIEKGTFSYTIHSFCSNVLKKEQNLSIDMYHTLEEQKDSMLATALQCFLSANKLWHDFGGRDIHDERWLHNYMFGKIAKKKDEEPSVYINYYLKSAALLHDIRALYPIVISYNSPQYLAVEALELYYRVHICILKTLEDVGDKPLPSSTIDVFKHAINVLAVSPFVTQAKEYIRNEKPKKITQKKTDTSSDEDLPVSKDVKDMIQDILGRVESDHSSSNPLKRKLLPIEEEPEDPLPQKEVSLDAEIIESGAASNIEKTTNSSSTSNETKDQKQKAEETSTSSSSSSTSKSSSSSSDSSSSSSNSSSGSSSSSDSSSSDSSTDSSSDSDSESDSEPPSKRAKLEVEGWSQEQQWLVEKCISALELCRKRFPEHYKSTYHLAHFYFKTKQYKNNEKVKELLLGRQGLFSERKQNNFFNGIWRIPNGEIDRPGSFAAHMGKCTLLLLDFLRETKDYNMLLDLAIHLKIVPEADKKYLRDNEREELSKEAATLCVQSLRKKLQESDNETLQKFIIELYYIYKKAKNNLKEPRFGTILNEAYQKLNNSQGEAGSMLESAIKYCQQQIQLEKQSLIAPQTQITTVSQTTTQLPVQTQVQQVPQQLPVAGVSCLIPPSIASPVSSHESLPAILQGNITSRRGARTGITRKPRGRPPGSGLGPRLPRGMSVSLFVSQQSELLRHYAQQNAELTRQLAAQNVNVNTTVNTNSTTTTSGQVLKDRPNLSITPLKPSVPTTLKNTPTSPSTKQIPPSSSISVLVSKKASPQYKSRKTNPPHPSPSSGSPGVQWPTGDAFRPPGLSIQPIQSTAPKSSNQEISLQHKILGAKKMINATEKSQPKKLPDLPFPSTSELTVRQISPKPRSQFISRPTPAVARKEVVNSISIIPTTAIKVEASKNILPLSPVPPDEKPKFLTKPQTLIPNIDSSVADALRTFGSTITITTTPNKKPTKIQDEMSITPVQQKKHPTSTQEPCEVIVLDD